MALNNFAPTACGMMGAAPGSSQRAAVPGGGGATLLVTNLGPSAVYVVLGSNTVVATPATGIAVLANASIALAVGTNTYIAAIGHGGIATINLAQGDVALS